MAPAQPDTEQLLDLAAAGDSDARGQLLQRHRQRLCKLVALRLDRRLAARADASDVIQDSLVEADRRLGDYLRQRTVPFYVWLRRLALERVTDQYRLHVRAQKRSVRREEISVSHLPDESLMELAQRLVAPGSSPDARLEREDVGRRVRAVLAGLPERDREVLAMRHLEQLSAPEIAAVLGVSEGAVKVRHVRALERLRQRLDEAPGEELPLTPPPPPCRSITAGKGDRWNPIRNIWGASGQTRSVTKSTEKGETVS
jgi:RNA polymerase sigma-70 factor (ECF subfamily)